MAFFGAPVGFHLNGQPGCSAITLPIAGLAAILFHFLQGFALCNPNGVTKPLYIGLQRIFVAVWNVEVDGFGRLGGAVLFSAGQQE